MSPTGKDEMGSFVTNNVENNDNDCSDTLDLFDFPYKNKQV